MKRGNVRSADGLLSPAVAATLAALPLEDKDNAAARLATVYASEIDAADAEARAEVLRDLGPRLLAALDALGATPKARALTGRGGGGSGGALAQLRASRA